MLSHSLNRIHLFYTDVKNSLAHSFGKCIKECKRLHQILISRIVQLDKILVCQRWIISLRKHLMDCVKWCLIRKIKQQTRTQVCEILKVVKNIKSRNWKWFKDIGEPN